MGTLSLRVEMPGNVIWPSADGFDYLRKTVFCRVRSKAKQLRNCTADNSNHRELSEDPTTVQCMYYFLYGDIFRMINYSEGTSK